MKKNTLPLTLKMEFQSSNGKNRIEKREGPKCIIGRGSGADVVIHEEEISRKHLQIEIVDAGKVLITDLGSANGSFIGDEKLEANKSVEFETFFIPIKLGKNVTFLLTLENL